MKGRDGAPLRSIPVGSGVQLVGERGVLGSRPLLYTSTDTSAKYALFEVTGSDVRVEGLHFRGPKPATDHKVRGQYIDAISVIENAEAQLGRRVVITDNEFEQWTGGGVEAIGAHGSILIENWNPAWLPLTRADAGSLLVERNYMHHNAMDGGGYGVVVGGGAYATVVGNVFDFNRHAVAASGKAYSGYVVRHNYVLNGGYRQAANNAPDFYNQHFDVHGTKDDGYGGYAGEYFEIAYNTIRGDQGYYAGAKTRAALMLRGKPAQGAFFHDNVAVHDDLDAAVSLNGGGDTGFGEDHEKFNFHASGNRFETDHSTEIASGDFDGDGRADVFVGNGTAWFYSRAGIQPWQYLRPSNKRVSELGFADIDNDGVTDVLYRESTGRLGYVKSGSAAPVTPLTTSPVPIRDLRFGDFDADGKSDIFFTRNRQWQVWYGATRTWTPTQTSVTPIQELLVGDFDGARGTDVAAVRNGAWSYSSGSTDPWARLNGKLKSSFANAVAADFDGNGRTDIAFDEGRKWRLSRDGRAPLSTLREGQDDGALKGMLVGRFDRGRRAQVVSFEKQASPAGGQAITWRPKEKLSIWHGISRADAFVTRSEQNMR